MTARKLSLTREPLAELAGADLAAVGGGDATGQCTAGCTDECGPTLPDPACLTLYGSRCIY